MKIEEIKVQAFRLDEIERLDPITVILQDIAPGVGSVLVSCYGEAWGAYWQAMGACDVRTFITQCDSDYLLNCLSRLKIKAPQKTYLLRVIKAVQEGLKLGSEVEG